MLFFVPPFSSSFPLYYLVIFLHLFLILFHFSVPFESENGAESVQIATTTGKIRGTVVKLEGQGTDEWTDVAVFLGIPYAEPPTGPLRFEKTIPLAENATRQMDAIEMPKMCVPHHRLDNWTSDWSDYGEDCLFLNIFTPWPNNRRVSLMPLLVLIYVGGFEVGIRRYRNYEEIGHKFLAHDIVVATVQFRIGFLGFASSGNEQMPGNFGYWDLTEALRWLCANAKAFGADPTRVTFHGYSASGTSVATLALSPHSRDLFQQTIQMSGPIFSSRAAGDRTVNTTRKIAVGVGCLDSAQLKECLKAKSVDQLFDAMDAIGSTLADVNYNLFGPVFDDDFLPANFSQLVRESTPKRSIIGVTELEPLAFTLIFGNNSLRHLAIPRDEFATFGREQMRMYMRQKAFKNEYYGQNDAEQLADEVAAFYGNLTDDENGREGKDNWFFLERTVLFLADVQFLVPFLWELREKVSNGWPLFVYVNKFVNAREIPRDFPPELHKSFHDSDHKYVLRHPYSTYKFDEDDLAMEKVMAQMFANFVQNGDPSFSDTAPWPIATHDFPFRHLAINFPELQIVTDFDLRRMRFWEQIGAKYPQYNLILGTSENDNFGTRPNDINWPQMVAIAAMAMLIGICYLG